mmetsp:Transcript_10453/g.23117  ORF Transcript_10453/g.23117 Transcript_10453/m.23117 type:complete len:84 (+) Transcript_10453:6849-7100(+)
MIQNVIVKFHAISVVLIMRKTKLAHFNFLAHCRIRNTHFLRAIGDAVHVVSRGGNVTGVNGLHPFRATCWWKAEQGEWLKSVY